MSTPNPPQFHLNEPAYFQIPAHSLPRAVQFWKAVLHLNIFNEAAAVDDAETGTVIHFQFPNTQPMRFGGILKLPRELGETAATGLQHGSQRGHAGVYFAIDDIEAKLEVVEANGGLRMSGKRPLGDDLGSAGWAADIRDTEGNFHGLYTPPMPIVSNV